MTYKNRYHRESCGGIEPCGHTGDRECHGAHKQENLCGYNNSKSCGMPLAMAYVVMQSFGETYAPETAICKGTLFPDLDKPFCGRRI